MKRKEWREGGREGGRGLRRDRARRHQSLYKVKRKGVDCVCHVVVGCSSCPRGGVMRQAPISFTLLFLFGSFCLVLGGLLHALEFTRALLPLLAPLPPSLPPSLYTTSSPSSNKSASSSSNGF